MLTVLNVAYPFAPVTPDAVGGAEQIASAVEKAAARAGYRSLVLACEGSKTEGQLFEVPRVHGALIPERQAEIQARYRAAIDRIVAEERVDVVHMHGVDFHTYLPREPAPVLATLHLPPEWYPPEVFAGRRPHTYLNCVSRSQRRRCPPCSTLLDDVPNGVDLLRFHPDGDEQDARSPRSLHAPPLPSDGYALMLGRICPEKGTHVALDAAHRAGASLLVAGDVFPFPEHVRYFEDEIRPRLDGQRQFIGPVAMDGKRELLAGASCLLVPSMVPETSSLVTMEALACGTPVIAFPNGALPEIIAHGQTGFLVRNLPEMVDAMGRAPSLQPADCRRAAERFALATTCSRYLALYRRLARDGAPVRSRHGTRAPRTSRQRHSVRTTVLAEMAELHALKAEWEDLWARAPDATVFQRPEWLLPWCKHLLQGEPRVLAIRQGGRLVGLAPFFVWNEGGARVLSLMGAGISDYADVLAASGERDTVARALAAWLDDAQGWDRCAWSEVPSGSLLLEIARAPNAPERRLRIDEQDVCPGIRLQAKSLRDTLSSRKWASVRNARNRAAREGGLDIIDATPGTFDTWFQRLAELHGERWREHGGGMLRDPRIRAFHREAGPELLRRGALVLSGVHIGGALSGVLYTFHDRTASRCYATGFDPARAHLGPGTLAFAHALERAIEGGHTLFDFLRGNEPYKYGWGAEDIARIHRIG
ncbi:GNAT family N-acetyltransferase [Pendulispora albinea]|uniref:GNAT family N-acetyltransferase n=1 Tax=Pendulispora albinea TaxID=2741071 RepID=A0ABZ2M707_9BACT